MKILVAVCFQNISRALFLADSAFLAWNYKYRGRTFIIPCCWDIEMHAHLRNVRFLTCISVKIESINVSEGLSDNWTTVGGHSWQTHYLWFLWKLKTGSARIDFRSATLSSSKLDINRWITSIIFEVTNNKIQTYPFWTNEVKDETRMALISGRWSVKTKTLSTCQRRWFACGCSQSSLAEIKAELCWIGRDTTGCRGKTGKHSFAEHGPLYSGGVVSFVRGDSFPHFVPASWIPPCESKENSAPVLCAMKTAQGCC